MSDAVAIELIRALPSVVGAGAAVIGGWFSYLAAAHGKANGIMAEQIKQQTDGLTKQLVDSVSKASYEDGAAGTEKTKAQT
jgi:hypothetical protein